MPKGSSQKKSRKVFKKNLPFIPSSIFKILPRIGGAQNSLKRSEHRGGRKTWRHIGLKLAHWTSRGQVGKWWGPILWVVNPDIQQTKWGASNEDAGRINIYGFYKKRNGSLVDFLGFSWVSFSNSWNEFRSSIINSDPLISGWTLSLWICKLYFFHYPNLMAGFPNLYLCQGLSSHYFHITGDGHQPNSRGLYTHYKDSYQKVGWPSPILRLLTMAHLKTRHSSVGLSDTIQPTCPGCCKHCAFLQQGWKRFDQRPIVFPQRRRYAIERIICIDQHLRPGHG